MASSSTNTDDITSKITTQFNHDVVKDSLKNHFKNSKNKITDEAVELVSELLKLLVIESSVRAAMQAKHLNKTTVSLENVESILPQLMLDFP